MLNSLFIREMFSEKWPIGEYVRVKKLSIGKICRA